MGKRRLDRFWTPGLAAVALLATALALYVQVFEGGARQEEARLTALRLDEALAGTRARLKAEILAELRAELAARPSGSPAGAPRPNRVLRRSETADGALEEADDPLRSRTGGRSDRLRSLAEESEQAERALRRDLEELRAATRRDAELSRRTTGLILAALIPLVLHLLLAIRPREEPGPTAPGGRDQPS